MRVRLNTGTKADLATPLQPEVRAFGHTASIGWIYAYAKSFTNPGIAPDAPLTIEKSGTPIVGQRKLKSEAGPDVDCYLPKS
jgi:hypothetical protein